MGLDFGTHQTKICINNSEDPRNPKFEFFEFDSPQGKVRMLPSVVQINKDDTLSYGFIDPQNATSLRRVHATEEPEKPKMKPYNEKPLPTEPREPRTIKDPIEPTPRSKNFAEKHKEWEETVFNNKLERRRLELQADIDRLEWVKECEAIKRENRIEFYRRAISNSLSMDEYMRRHKDWEENDVVNVPAIFRYFKIATFSQSAAKEWKRTIDAKVISTWYLAYILFLIKNRFGGIFFTQMGIPQSIEDTDHQKWQENNANDVFFSAYRLMMSYETLEAYQKATYKELLEKTSFSGIDFGSWSNPGLMILPEAFAGLQTITHKKMVSNGFNLLVDIGGGSTDISLFLADSSNDEPNISKLISIHKGINSILSTSSPDRYSESMNSDNDKLRLERDQFADKIDSFNKDIRISISNEIIKSLINAGKPKNIDAQRIYAAMNGRPIIYSGGGSLYPEFCTRMMEDHTTFNDVMNVTRRMFDESSIINTGLSDSEFPVLAVAYGLSIPKLEPPQMQPIDKLFTQSIHAEGREGYEHGVTDL